MKQMLSDSAAFVSFLLDKLLDLTRFAKISCNFDGFVFKYF